jgi:hypothetical protein
MIANLANQTLTLGAQPAPTARGTTHLLTALDDGACIGYDWRTEAIDLYRLAHARQRATIAAEVALQVEALTGIVVPADEVYVDPQTCRATVTLEGATFRLLGGNLALVRPCSYCGCGLYESTPITTREDLGYALSAWEPLCADCPCADETDWVEV